MTAFDSGPSVRAVSQQLHQQTLAALTALAERSSSSFSAGGGGAIQGLAGSSGQVRQQGNSGGVERSMMSGTKRSPSTLSQLGPVGGGQDSSSSSAEPLHLIERSLPSSSAKLQPLAASFGPFRRQASNLQVVERSAMSLSSLTKSAAQHIDFSKVGKGRNFDKLRSIHQHQQQLLSDSESEGDGGGLSPTGGAAAGERLNRSDYRMNRLPSNKSKVTLATELIHLR